jgi:hypothetical protein
MRPSFLIAFFAVLIGSSIYAVLYSLQNLEVDKTMRDAGYGIAHEETQEIATENAFAVKALNNPNLVNHRAHGETTGVSGFPWKDRLRKAIEDCVRTIKNLSTSVRHRISTRLAPDGVYFTMRYFSVSNAHGITGIAPGTKVVRVRDDGSMLRVRTGDVEFEATAQDLTNDLDVAATVSRGDAQRQQAVASYIHQEQAIHPIQPNASPTPR